MAVADVQGGPAPPVAGGPTAAAKFKAAAPVAAGALAIVAAIAGGSMLTSNSADQPLPPEASIAANETPAGPATAPALPIDPAANPPIAASPTVNPPAASAQVGNPAPRPGSAIPGVQFDQTPAAGIAQGMEIVVKFKDDAKVKDIIDAFWKDQPSAKAKFDALKARRPEFASLKLDRITYSNELVLVHDGSAPAAQRLAAMRETAAKLGKVADISYAEPNLTAHPGGQ